MNRHQRFQMINSFSISTLIVSLACLISCFAMLRYVDKPVAWRDSQQLDELDVELEKQRILDRQSRHRRLSDQAKIIAEADACTNKAERAAFLSEQIAGAEKKVTHLRTMEKIQENILENERRGAEIFHARQGDFVGRWIDDWAIRQSRLVEVEANRLSVLREELADQMEFVGQLEKRLKEDLE